MTHTFFDSRASPSEHAPLLEVSVRPEGESRWLVEVRGELDLCTGPVLRHRLRSYLQATGADGPPRSLVYLLSGLDFMDAAGLHELLTAVEGCGPEAVTIRAPSARVRRLLDLVGLDSLIEEGTIR